jgi:uncharacterized delta-60 repeat protein
LMSLAIPAVAGAATGPGSFDPSFGTGGLALMQFTPAGATQGAGTGGIARQSDGKLVVAGSAPDGSGGRQLVVTRINADGTLDTSFDASGAIGGKPGAVAMQLDTVHHIMGSERVALQSDGKIVVAGYLDTPALGYPKAYALRLSTDGTLDSSFGGPSLGGPMPGVAIYQFGQGANTSTEVDAVVIAPGDRILLGGYANGLPLAVGGFVVARLDSHGNLDQSFDPSGNLGGIKGIAAFLPPKGNGVQALALQPDGQIVAMGDPSDVQNHVAVGVARLAADGGSLDQSFGSSGSAVFQLGAGTGSVTLGNGLALQSDGKLVICGWRSRVLGGDEAYVMRLDNAGNPDPSFGAQGIYANQFASSSSGFSSASGIALTPTGKLVVSGYGTYDPSKQYNNFVVAVLRGDGTLDSSSASSGTVITQLGQGATPSSASGPVLLEPDGRIIAGISATDSGGTSQLGAVRLLGADPPIASFTSAPAVPQAAKPASFDGTGSSDPAGGGITSYAWNFGDGGAGSGSTVTHAYAKPGSYTVTLTVTDAGGLSASTTQTITVIAAKAPRPSFNHFKQSRKRWKLRKGTMFTLTLNEPANLTLTFARLGKHNRKRAAASLTISGHAGPNTINFRGRISRHLTLKPGRYTLTIVAVGADGQRSTPASVSFTILP